MNYSSNRTKQKTSEIAELNSALTYIHLNDSCVPCCITTSECKRIVGTEVSSQRELLLQNKKENKYFSSPYLAMLRSSFLASRSFLENVIYAINSSKSYIHQVVNVGTFRCGNICSEVLSTMPGLG